MNELQKHVEKYMAEMVEQNDGFFGEAWEEVKLAVMDALSENKDD